MTRADHAGVPIACVLLLAAAGCETTTTPGPVVGLDVRVIFSDARVLAPRGGVPISRVRAAAFEDRDGELVLRDTDEAAVAPADTTFRLVLQVPPAPDYVIDVAAIGERPDPSGGTEEVGLFAGRSRTGEVGRETPPEVVVELVPFQPAPRLRIRPQVPCDVYEIVWPDVAGATAYRVTEQLLEEGTADTLTTTSARVRRSWPPDPGGAGRGVSPFARYRVQALFQGGIAGDVSDSVDVARPVVPIEDLCWASELGDPSSGGQGVTGDGAFLAAARPYGTELVVGGGLLTNAGSASISAVAAWNDSTWRALGSTFGFDDQVLALAEFGGNLVAAGSFVQRDILAWDGVAWFSLGPVDAEVRALVPYEDRLIAGGTFSQVDQVPSPRVAAWTGAGWEALSAPGTGCVSSAVNALAVHDGWLVAAGLLSDDCQIFTNVVAYRDGLWSPMTPPPNGAEVAALVIYDGELIAGAGETVYIYTPGPAYADGSWVPMGSGFSIDGRITCFGVHDGRLFAGGSALLGFVAEWTGVEWTSLGSGLFGGEPRAMASYGGDLYVVGEFFGAGPWSSSLIARWER